jgi:hypothetical protein
MNDFSGINDFMRQINLLGNVGSSGSNQGISSSTSSAESSKLETTTSSDFNSWFKDQIQNAALPSAISDALNDSADLELEDLEAADYNHEESCRDSASAEVEQDIGYSDSEDMNHRSDLEDEGEDVNDIVDSEGDEDTAAKRNVSSRGNSKDAWITAHQEPIVAGLDSVYQKCNSRCTLSGHCASGISGEAITKLRKDFHGLNITEAPRDKDRALKIIEYFQKARKDKDDNLIFTIEGKEVCCPTYLRFLGVSTSTDMRDAPRQWTRLLKGFIHGCGDELFSRKEIKLDEDEKWTEKKVSRVALLFYKSFPLLIH